MSLNAAPPSTFGVLITEVMFDPEPAVGEPASDYIELLNHSDSIIDLHGWTIRTNADEYKILEHPLLWPGEYIVITANPASFGDSTVTRIQLRGFSLANSGGYIVLQDPDGKKIHAMTYEPAMHSTALKQKGGWSLELANIDEPCRLNQNWQSSKSVTGGTPGKNNSVGMPVASDGLEWVNAWVSDNHLYIEINRWLDSAGLAPHLQLSIQPALTGVQWFIAGIENQLLVITTPQLLDTQSIYAVEVKGIADCTSTSHAELTGRFGLPSALLPGDVIFNEVMCHPATGSAEYIELYNRSAKVIDLQGLYLSKVKENGTTGELIRLTENPRLLMPGEYVVISRAPDAIDPSLLAAPRASLDLSDCPTLPDEGATLVLADLDGNIIDRLSYSEDWHLPLLAEKAGVALERITESTTTDPSSNWTSAAAPLYGTPGRRNSQANTGNISAASIHIEPEVFTPDNDGNNDMLTISYSTRNARTLASIRIADINGRIVKTVANNFITGAAGSWRWNGFDELQRPLPTGIYVVVAEFFDLAGKKSKFRQAVTLAHPY